SWLGGWPASSLAQYDCAPDASARPAHPQGQRTVIHSMSLAQSSLFVGTLLVMMVLAGTLLGWQPLFSAMVYLALGWLLEPDLLLGARHAQARRDRIQADGGALRKAG
ncbi:MAG TPA: hypothetical protein VIY30_16350, partial [Burkholderiaceae bacterium]